MKRIAPAIVLSCILFYCSPSGDSWSRHIIHSRSYPEIYYVYDSLSSGVVQIDSVLSDDPHLAVEQVEAMVSNPQKKYQIQGYNYMYDPELHMIRLEKNNDEE